MAFRRSMHDQEDLRFNSSLRHAELALIEQDLIDDWFNSLDVMYLNEVEETEEEIEAACEFDDLVTAWIDKTGGDVVLSPEFFTSRVEG